jgi:O-antigen ligase
MAIYYLLLAVMPLERHYLWTSTFGALTVIKYIGAAAAVYALAYSFVRRGRVRYFRTWAARAYCVYAVGALLSYAMTGNMAEWQSSVFSIVLSNLLMFFVTVTLIDSPRRLRRVLLVLIGAVAFASLYIIRDWQKYHGFYDSYRPSGAAGDPNYFCLTAVACLPVAVYLAFERRSLLQRVFCVGCVVITIIAVLLGASRGGFLGMAAIGILMAWRARRKRVLTLTAIFLVLVVPGLVYPTSPLRRLLAPTATDSSNAKARTDVWAGGVRIVAENAVFGIGLGRFKSVIEQYEKDDQEVITMAHNTYLEIAAEMGIPMFCIWMLIFGSAITILQRARERAAKARVSVILPAATAIQTGLVGMLPCIAFISAEFEKDLWLFVFLSIAVYSLALRCRPRPERQEIFRRASGAPALVRVHDDRSI